MSDILEAWGTHCTTCNENAQSPFESFAAGFSVGQNAEREACAVICENMEPDDHGRLSREDFAEAIRQRGEA